MTNEDWARAVVDKKDIRKLATMNGNCSICLCQDLCEERYPDGASDEKCTEVVDDWLKRERE